MCKKEKPATAFKPSQLRKQRWRPCCRKCNSQYQLKYRRKYPEKVREYRRKYQHRRYHSDAEYRKSVLAYAAKYKKRRMEYEPGYREKINAEKRKRDRMRYYQNLSESRRKAADVFRARYQSIKDKEKARKAEWYRKNRDKVRLAHAAYALSMEIGIPKSDLPLELIEATKLLRDLKHHFKILCKT